MGITINSGTSLIIPPLAFRLILRGIVEQTNIVGQKDVGVCRGDENSPAVISGGWDAPGVSRASSTD